MSSLTSLQRGVLDNEHLLADNALLGTTQPSGTHYLHSPAIIRRSANMADLLEPSSRLVIEGMPST